MGNRRWRLNNLYTCQTKTGRIVPFRLEQTGVEHEKLNEGGEAEFRAFRMRLHSCS